MSYYRCDVPEHDDLQLQRQVDEMTNRIEELRQHIGSAMAELGRLSQHTSIPTEHARLEGKRQGLALAFDYLRALKDDPFAARSCPKCFSGDLIVTYHADGHACSFSDRRRGGSCYTRMDCCKDTEHLRVGCRRCGWAQHEEVQA